MSFCQQLRDLQISLWKKNTLLVQAEVRKRISPELDKKIRNECEMKSWERTDVIRKIQTDSMFASYFAKNPLKQNIAENLQLKFLKPHFPCVRKLPTKGKKSIYISRGNFRNTKGNSKAKSIDFADDISYRYFYAKYISADGGSQDNQYQDVRNFISEVQCYLSHHQSTYYCFHIIIDGPYFTKDRVQQLIREGNHPRIHFSSSDTIGKMNS